MTDITELAQSLKATAEPISSGYLRNWIVSHDDETCWVGANDDDGNLTPFIEVSIADWSGNKADNEKLARFIALCRPANVLALVEALEKAQTGEKQWREVVDAFCADDADWHKLTNSTNALISLLSQALYKQADRIAELESLTVKLPERYACEVGYNAPDPNGDMLDRDDVIAVLTAAGIKVEAE